MSIFTAHPGKSYFPADGENDAWRLKKGERRRLRPFLPIAFKSECWRPRCSPMEEAGFAHENHAAYFSTAFITYSRYCLDFRYPAFIASSSVQNHSSAFVTS